MVSLQLCFVVNFSSSPLSGFASVEPAHCAYECVPSEELNKTKPKFDYNFTNYDFRKNPWLLNKHVDCQRCEIQCLFEVHCFMFEFTLGGFIVKCSYRCCRHTSPPRFATASASTRSTTQAIVELHATCYIPTSAHAWCGCSGKHRSDLWPRWP